MLYILSDNYHVTAQQCEWKSRVTQLPTVKMTAADTVLVCFPQVNTRIHPAQWPKRQLLYPFYRWRCWGTDQVKWSVQGHRASKWSCRHHCRSSALELLLSMTPLKLPWRSRSCWSLTEKWGEAAFQIILVNKHLLISKCQEIHIFMEFQQAICRFQ